MTTISPKEQQAFVNCKTANSIWVKLAAQYLQNASASTHVLQERFFHYQFLKGHSMMSHITAIEGLAQQLEDLGSPMSQSQIMTKIVSTLPTAFRNFMTVWDNLPDTEKTMPQLITKLMNEQHRNVCASPSSSKITSVNTDIEAFAATSESNRSTNSWERRSSESGRPSQSREKRAVNPDKKRPREECDFCGKLNHSELTCTRRIHAEAGHPDDKCTYCRNYDHTAAVCRKRIRDERNESKTASRTVKFARTDTNGVALIAFGASQIPMSEHLWYADSGATHHMCSSESCMQNYTHASTSRSVTGIGGVQLNVHGQGDVHVTTKINGNSYNAVLHNVLHVPGLGTNLLSIPSTTERGIDVHFTGQSVSFMKNGTAIMAGSRVGRDLYELDISTADPSQTADSSQIDAIVCSAVTSRQPISIWHQRLSHTSYKTIIKMVSNGLVDGIDLQDNSTPSSICPGCAFGKMHRLPFKHGRRRATQVGEIIHSDVCGPMEPPSPGGARYYVSFKDDLSGYCVIYFLRLKSEVFDRFKLFVCKIESETNQSVRTLRSDGGGEFISKEFSEWLTEKSIRHEIRASHTPKHNGVSERGHRTIGEAERSSMHMNNIPLELWAESYNCANYTLNRTLSSNASVTPFELWFGRKPNLRHLRIFGCEAYMHVPDCDRHKLEPKSLKCLFVGYCENTKAYRLWDPASRRLKISRDVIFNESPAHDVSTHHDSLKSSHPADECRNLSDQTKTAAPRHSSRIPQPKKLWAEFASTDESDPTTLPLLGDLRNNFLRDFVAWSR
jgi:hypothetical protein